MNCEHFIRCELELNGYESIDLAGRGLKTREKRQAKFKRKPKAKKKEARADESCWAAEPYSCKASILGRS